MRTSRAVRRESPRSACPNSSYAHSRAVDPSCLMGRERSDPATNSQATPRSDQCSDDSGGGSVAEQVVESLLLLLFRSLSDPLQERERVLPVLSRERVSWSSFPLAAPLPSIDSTGVTRVFADFSQVGTTSASDSSEDCCGLRLLPSRPCLRLTIAAGPCRGLPVSVHKACDDVPNSETSPGASEPRPTLSAGTPWPSAMVERVGSGDYQCFEAESPGPSSRSPTLRVVGRPTMRKDRASPGVGLLPG